MVDNKNSEFTYYPHFERWLHNQGYETCTSMRIWCGLELDIVGIKYFKTVPPKIILIEVKISDWERVKQQCVKRLSMADEVYIGLIMKKNIGYFLYKLAGDIEFLEKHNIGLLLWDEVRNMMFKVLSAKNHKYPRKISVIETFKKEIIKDFRLRGTKASKEKGKRIEIEDTIS